MENELAAPLCLEIPIPRCLTWLPQTPPMCIPCQGDLQTIQILKEFGDERQRCKDEITQACNLASGSSDIVVILERPRWHESHNFDVSFGEFVESSPTLRAIDQLIRLGSNGARSIHTVTVLNAFSYQPSKYWEDTSRYQQTLKQLLQTKKPKVIIHCHNTLYSDPWMKRFNFLDKPRYRLDRKTIEISHDHEATVIPSFHPSYALNHNSYRSELRILLMYHFVGAFDALNNMETVSCQCSNKILEECLKVKDNVCNPAEWEIAYRISKTFKESYHGPKKDEAPCCGRGLTDDEPDDRRKNREAAFDAMAFWFVELSREPQAFDFFGIVCAGLLLREMSCLYPVYSRLDSWLLRQVVQREHWFCDGDDSMDGDTPDLEDALSALAISKSNVIS